MTDQREHNIFGTAFSQAMKNYIYSIFIPIIERTQSTGVLSIEIYLSQYLMIAKNKVIYHVFSPWHQWFKVGYKNGINVHIHTHAQTYIHISTQRKMCREGGLILEM